MSRLQVLLKKSLKNKKISLKKNLELIRKIIQQITKNLKTLKTIKILEEKIVKNKIRATEIIITKTKITITKKNTTETKITGTDTKNLTLNSMQ